MEDQRYRVSGINRNLLQKGFIVGGIAALVIILVFLVMPMKYYFVFKDGTLGLYTGRIGWFDAKKDKAFSPVYLGEGKDSALEAITSMKFNTREEALNALQPVMLHRIHAHLMEITELEQTMFNHYHTLLGEMQAAQQTGISGFEDTIGALKQWLHMYAGRTQAIDICTSLKAQEGAGETQGKTSPKKKEEKGVEGKSQPAAQSKTGH